jgi:hypothetical protein
MAKTILRKTPHKVAVKVYGSAVNETISLATDCLHTTEVVSGTPAVDVMAMHWAGATGAFVTITRGGTVIATLVADNPGQIFFDQAEFRDSINNTNDIVVTSTGLVQLWLELRKVAGYKSKIETAEFSQYDDTTAVGS